MFNYSIVSFPFIKGYDYYTLYKQLVIANAYFRYPIVYCSLNFFNKMINNSEQINENELLFNGFKVYKTSYLDDEIAIITSRRRKSMEKLY